MDDINIKYPTRKFDFSKISLTYPKSVASGSYFTKILYEGAPLYLQIPKCTTKSGLVKAAKKMSSELLLDNMNEEIVGWFENLDNRSKELIQQHSEEWFGKEISSEDIDNAFGSTIRLYRSGKFSLVKTNIKVHATTDVPLISVYDENQTPQPVDSITAETNIVSILEITGIRFTSKHFNVDIDMKQIMIVNDLYEEDVCFNKCLITPRGKSDATLLIQKADPIPFVIEKSEDPISILTAQTENLDIPTNSLQESLEVFLPEMEASMNSCIEVDVDIEPIEIEPELESEPEELSEVDCLQSLGIEEMTLNKPEEIYYELYRKTKQKAKEALLEAKRIKEQYQLDVSDWETSDEEYEDD